MGTLTFGLTFLVAFGANMLEFASAGNPQLIVVSIPGGPHARYYKRQLGRTLQPIIDMFGEYSKQVKKGGDEFLVLFGVNEKKLILDSEDKFSTETHFLQVDRPIDIWMRDFSTVVTSEQGKFKYRPDYLKARIADSIEDDFTHLINTVLGEQFNPKSCIILDGGNVVENGVDKAIITDRILFDNFCENKSGLNETLGKILKRKVAFITDPGPKLDFTGHADGYVAFIDNKKLMISDFGYEGELQENINRIKNAFGETAVDIVRLPSYLDLADDRSAEGVYVNMLVSDFAIYMPVFGSDSYDNEAYNVVSSAAQNSGKAVYKVDASKLAHMGGSVRCMSWQLYKNNHIAEALLDKSKTIDQL